VKEIDVIATNPLDNLYLALRRRFGILEPGTFEPYHSSWSFWKGERRVGRLQFPALPDKGAGARTNTAAAMLGHGASAAEVLKHILPKGELAKFNPHYLGLGPGGGQFTTAERDTTNSRDTRPQGYVTNLSGEEILEQAIEYPKTLGWPHPLTRQG
jgi:hypothetical protein